MKVIKAYGPGDLRVTEAPLPCPPPGYVRIKVRASGICGSDKWVWTVKGPSDSIAGHEVAGEVDALGDGVYSLAPGDRVAVNNAGGCGTCPACRMGAFVLCPGWDGSLDVNNGFGEYLVAPARNCMKLLPGIDFIDGALIMDNWGTPYGGVKRGGIGPGMDVLVNGCGPIGQAAVALCKAFGAYVLAADPVPSRRDAALALGAAKAFAPGELSREVRECTQGLGVHAVMECSGAGAAYEPCLDSLRVGGSLIAIGEHAEYPYQSSERIIRRSLRIVGTWYSTMGQGGEVMRLAADGRINLKSFLTHTVTLEEVPGIFEAVMNMDKGIIKCVVVFE
jgi:threonine dehydrogenase-like Zn-dependent dehydrogenase